jgi:hypothetical protein
MKSRSFKLLLSSFFTVLLGGQIVLAETETLETINSKPKGYANTMGRTNGMYIETMYSMLKTEATASQSYVINPTVILNEPIHTVGFGVGYRRLRTLNIGLEVGGQVLQESNRLGNSYNAFYQLNGSVTYSFNSNLYGFGGPNLNYLAFVNNGDYSGVKSSPNFGGQVGLGYIHKGVYGKIGYQYMQYTSQLEYGRTVGSIVTINNDFKMSGVMTQLGYNF